VNAAPEPVIAVLDEEWTSIATLYRGLDAAQWETPTDLPGWTVRDLLSHIVGTESMLLGDPSPSVDVSGFAHVKNDIGKFNEAWVETWRNRPGAEVLAEFQRVTDARRTALAAMTAADFDAESWTPVGQAPYRRFMEIRVFDCWMHEQDAREALGVPGARDGAPAQVALDEATRALGFIVGKRAAAPDGASVRFELTGPIERTIDVLVDGRARVVDRIDGPPTATLTADAATFCRLAGGRADPDASLADGGVRLAGDPELGQRLLHNLNFVI
jgi:uncharacterized protein (TIGR03083 family)